MHSRLFAAGCWLIVVWLILSPHPGQAAAIKGRVVDSAGRPVAGAEVRFWRKIKAPDGSKRNEPITFNGLETLNTDGVGRFAAPDVFDTAIPVRMVAQAKGMLAGRSGWVFPEKNITDMEDLVLRRLRSVSGEVVDRLGISVPGATVFNSGDGHARVETKTNEQGRFTLEGVPEGMVFLFAEKQGYRFSGIVCRGDNDQRITLTRDGDKIEPLAASAPSVSDAESAELGRKLLEPYLQAVIERGSEADLVHCDHALAQVDPQRALDLAKAFAGVNGKHLDNARFTAILAWIHRQPDDWDEIAALIASQDDHWNATRLYLGGVDAMPAAQRGRKLEWLADALAHARHLADPVPRCHFLAWIGVEFIKLDRQDRAQNVLEEATSIAKELPRDDFDAMLAFERIAVACCRTDFPASVAWLDRINHAGRYGYACGTVAAELADDRPVEAETIWARPDERSDVRAIAGRANLLPNFFFRMVQSDRHRADRLASHLRDPGSRVRACGAISRGAAQSDVTAGRSSLVEAVGDATTVENALAEPADFEETLSTSIAWLIPIAGRVAPDMTTELVWRAISMREPRPTVGRLDDETELADAALAKMLAPFHREVARALIEPLVPRLRTFVQPASDGQQLWEMLTAAAIIDPRWSVELFGSLPEPPDLASYRPQNQTRMWLARLLAHPYKRRLECLNYFDP
jgi:hypothetical protein